MNASNQIGSVAGRGINTSLGSWAGDAFRKGDATKRQTRNLAKIAADAYEDSNERLRRISTTFPITKEVAERGLDRLQAGGEELFKTWQVEVNRTLESMKRGLRQIGILRN